MRRLLSKCPLIACAALLIFVASDAAPAAAEPVRIAIAGDSTARDYTTMSGDYAELRGWGQYITELMTPGSVAVLNHGKGGCSSKSFVAEGRWDKLLAEKPNYVLIQFGHNDNPGKGPERETLPGPMPDVLPTDGLGSKPEDWYRHNMKQLIQQARDVGAVPIVVTPMERRAFKSNGKSVREKNKPWADAAKLVAQETDTPVIDLNAYSFTLYNKLGFEGSAFMHPQREAEFDNTHYNETGARIWAEYIVGQLGAAAPDLKASIQLPATATVDQPVEP